MSISYLLRAMVGRRRFDLEVTSKVVPHTALLIRGIPESRLDRFIDAAIEEGRSVIILRSY